MPDGATDNAQPQSFARSSLAFALLTTRLSTSTLRERRSPRTLTNGTPAPKLAASGDLRADPPTLSTPRPGLFASLCTRQPAPIVGRRRTGSSTPVRSLRLSAAPPSCPVGQLSAASTLLRNLDVVCRIGPVHLASVCADPAARARRPDLPWPFTTALSLLRSSSKRRCASHPNSSRW